MRQLSASLGVIAMGVAALAITCAGEGRAEASWPKQGMAAGGRGDFCGRSVARDYLQPLKRMTLVPRVPSSGRLPFAPKLLRLEPKGGKLVVGEGLVGFGFRDEAVGQVRRLNWEVSTQLQMVDAKGVVVNDLGSKRRRLGAIKGNRIGDFLFRISGAPAYYRVDITFVSSKSHQVLGRFSHYVRLVRPRFDARLLARGSVVRQGEVLAVRLANFGTETVSSASSDWRFSVQRYEGQGWTTAPSSPAPEKRQPIIRKLPAGQMDKCIRFRVPLNERPGPYRVSMVVDRSLRRTGDRAVQLTAEFEVSGRSLK